MATLTITTTVDQAARVAAAFGANFTPPRNATAAEVKADVIAYMKGRVHSYETQQAATTAANAVVPMSDPT